MDNILGRFKSYLESIKITPVSWLAGVSGVLMVRFFLESLSNPTSTGFFASDASTLINYYLFFMATLLAFMVFFQIVLPSWKNVAPQFVAISSLGVLVAPVIDWIISGGKGLKMTYFFVGNGATFGLKIEIALGLLFLGLFVYFISKSWKRAIVSTIILFTTVFVLASLPGIISLVGQGGRSTQSPLVFLVKSIENSSTVSNNIHSSLQYSSMTRLLEISFNFIMGKILFLISVVTLFFLARTNYKEKLNAVIKNFRAERVFSYVLMIFFGIFIAYSNFSFVKLNWNDWLSVIILCFSFVFSCLFAICANDMADEDTDKISNADRPLISNALSKWDMKQMGAVFILISLLAGFLAGYTAFFFVLTFTALYYIYSVPPTRLKLIPFFSSFLISLCMLSAVIAGFYLVSPIKYVSAFPSKLVLSIVIIFSLLANVRDMKDIEGDRAAGIKTMPIIFGDIWGPRAVAISAGLAVLLVPVFSGLYILFIPAIPTALVSYYFINKKPYREKPISIVYFAFMFAGFLLLFF